ncbi:hypothetical protein RRG08_052407 [Elysia crispata]|uniref:Uncharacterized protein n=1 Tax=Elysia crispata TaxID=231223 RepID=A0AAE1E8F5_9GAST|nr:hypothetical protein RRG08_052407 [Elysia crispata]
MITIVHVVHVTLPRVAFQSRAENGRDESLHIPDDVGRRSGTSDVLRDHPCIQDITGAGQAVEQGGRDVCLQTAGGVPQHACLLELRGALYQFNVIIWLK